MSASLEGEFLFNLLMLNFLLMGWGSHNVSFQCADGTSLAFIAGDMPDYLRSSLETNILGALGSDVMRSVDSLDDAYEDFGAIHFSWYSRCATKVSSIYFSFKPPH